MEGLLDFIKTPEGQGLLSMVAGGLASAGRGGPLNSLGAAGLAGLQGYAGAQERQDLRAQSQQMQQLRALQIDGLQRSTEQAALAQRAIRNALMPVQPIDANAVSGIAGPRPEALAVVGQPPKIDYQQLIAQGVPLETARALAEAPYLGRPKVARVEETMDAQGRPVKRQFSEYGDQLGADLGAWKDKQVVNFGDAQYTRDPVTGRLELLRRNGQSPDSAASNALGWANHNLAGERLTFDKTQGGKPQFHDGQWVTPPSSMAAGQAVPAVPLQPVKDANEALNLIRQAREIIPKSTGSYLGNAIDIGVQVFGGATEGAKNAAQLKALEGALVSKMPKMSGPQSDNDVAMYRQMAGEIGNPNTPPAIKQAALQAIEEIQRRYANQGGASGDWSAVEVR